MQYRMFFVGDKVVKTFLDGGDPYEKRGKVAKLNPTGSFDVEFEDSSIEVGCTHNDPAIRKVIPPKSPAQ